MNLRQNAACIRYGFPLCFAVFFAGVSPAQDMRIKADATEIHRHLIKTTTEYQVQPGEVALLYPEWVPGIHGPRGPLANLAEMAVADPQGNALNWHRDPQYAFRFLVQVPPETRRIVVKLTYIGNQNSVNSTGVDSYGTALLGVMNWNTCLLYPEGTPVQQIEASLRLTMPEHWQYGTSLIEEQRAGGTIQFEPVSFHELIDSPVIMGEYFRTIDLSPPEGPPHVLHVAAESDQALRPGDATIHKLKHLVREALALFDRAHFETYHFLLVLSDNLPRTGLEHLKSSLNVVGGEGLTDEDRLESTGLLLAHEYAHSWCGKYHRPHGMITPNYNTPKDTRMLWVYEGLDTYLGEVLAARSGLIVKENEDRFKQALERLARITQRQILQKGRRRITLEDVASSAYLRRGGSENWRYLNRPQDYYYEGEMLWLHCDALIRHHTHGQKSLDDFIHNFLGQHEEAKKVLGYDEAEIYRQLNAVYQHDWRAVIDRYVKQTQKALPLDFLTHAGYRVQFSNKPTDYDDEMMLHSLGLLVNEAGTLTRVVPGMPADRAGLYKGVKILGINGKTYSKNRLQDAIAESVAAQRIPLLVAKGETIQRVSIAYDQGPRYFDLVRNPDRPDWLQKLFQPLVAENEK